MKQRLRAQRTNLILKGSISLKIHTDERSWTLQKLKVATLATQVEREGPKPYLLSNLGRSISGCIFFAVKSWVNFILFGYPPVKIIGRQLSFRLNYLLFSCEMRKLPILHSLVGTCMAAESAS